MTTELYTPKEIDTNKQEYKTIRLFLQGKPKSGKTFAVLTFPNVVVLNFDNALPPGCELPKVQFWDANFCAKYSADNKLKTNRAGEAPNRRDIFKHWLRANISKFHPSQTIYLNSWGFLQNCVDQQGELEPVITKTGEVDKFAFWKIKLQYSIEICEMLKAAPCNVVVDCHETIERANDGTPTGKLEPLMSGQFKDQLKGHFTDCYRQIARAKKGPDGKDTDETEWVWQIKSDTLADCSCSIAAIRNNKFIKADYASLGLMK